MMTERKLKSRSQREQEQPLEKNYKALGARHLVGTLSPTQRQQAQERPGSDEADKNRGQKQQG